MLLWWPIYNCHTHIFHQNYYFFSRSICIKKKKFKWINEIHWIVSFDMVNVHFISTIAVFQASAHTLATGLKSFHFHLQNTFFVAGKFYRLTVSHHWNDETRTQHWMAWQIHIARTKNVYSIFVLCSNSVCMPFCRWMHSILNDFSTTTTAKKETKLKALWMNEWMKKKTFAANGTSFFL